MQTITEYLLKNGPISWAECLSAFSLLLDSEAGKSLELPVNTNSFLIEETSKNISVNPQRASADFAFESPEAALDRPCDERSFVYSMGCVLYACLSGSAPFKETKVDRLKELQISEMPLPLYMRSLKNDFPLELTNLVEKSIAKNPQQRFQDRASLVQAMKEISSEIKPQTTAVAEKKSVTGILVAMAALPILSFGLSHNFFTQKLIADSHPTARQPYHLSIESSDYRAQMEFGENKLEPAKGEKPIQILNFLTKKIMFATTKRKNFKEALEEAVRRQLDLKGADLSNQDLTGANLHGARFSKAFFTKSKLKNANLYSCFIDGAIFNDCEMENCMLQEVHADQTEFTRSKLSGSTLVNGFFLQANFENCDLSKCNLTNAKLNQANLTKADLTDAVLDGVSRSPQTWESAKVTKAQLDKTDLIK